MKIGNTVRFLNAVGGGTITRFDEKNNMVYVEDADGFEIPTLIRDCVVIGSVSAETNFPRKTAASSLHSTQNPTPTKSTENKALSTAQLEAKNIVHETPYGDHLRALLAFFPVEIKQLQTTPYDCFLVNDSNYYLFYNLIHCIEGNWRTVSTGTIEPNTQEELCSITKEQLNNWEQIRVQITAYKHKTYQPLAPLDVSIKLNVIRFLKLHSFTENEYFDEPSLLVDIVAESAKKQYTDITGETIKAAILNKEHTRKRISPPNEKPKQTEIIEVDLHIHQLVETTAGLNNASMLELQMDTFHKTLDENKNRKGQKIVFIHGKGEGVLRKEIEKELKTRYGKYTYQDASFREYGFGATMVIIR